MLKLVKYSIVTNIILGLLFIYTNYTIWNAVNGTDTILIISHWGPIGISASHYAYFNGSLSIGQAIFWYLNTPFWLFWGLLIVNLFFILKLQRRNETKSIEVTP